MTAAGGIWIQGGGEMASGVAVSLVHEGYAVLVADIAQPLAVRRRVCFCEAVHGQEVAVAGVPGRLVPAAGAAFGSGWVPVIVDPTGSQMTRLRPLAVVDGRMTKRAPAPLPCGGAPLVGLGPGFAAGRDADLVIETHRGSSPGKVLAAGSASPDTGVPGEVGGQTSARLLRAPAAGRLVPLAAIGDLVRAGQIVATVAGRPVVSRLDGMLRGLIHGDAELSTGMKVGDVDPRGSAVDPAQLSDKALAIGRGVVEALRRLGVVPDPAAGGGADRNGI